MRVVIRGQIRWNNVPASLCSTLHCFIVGYGFIDCASGTLDRRRFIAGHNFIRIFNFLLIYLHFFELISYLPVRFSRLVATQLLPLESPALQLRPLFLVYL